MSYSIVIPMIETIHIHKFRICGVSKRSSRETYVHYNSSGKAVGYSRRILWLFWIHRGLISKWDAIYKLW